MANAAIDLTTLETLKARLGLWGVAVNESDNSELERLVTDASQTMHGEIGWNVIQAARVDSFDGDGGRRVWLQYATSTVGEPLWSCSVTSVVVDEVTIPAYVAAVGQTPATDGWRLTGKDRIDLVGYTYRFTQGAPVVITYTAGFAVASIPKDIASAVTEYAAMRWKERDRIGQTYKVVSSEVVDFRGGQVWAALQSVAKRYHRVVA